MAPHAPQAGQQVLELRELDLHACFSGTSTRGKDVQNQFGPIHDTHAEELLEVLALSRAQFFVEDHEITLVLFHQFLQLLRLSLTDVEPRVRPIDPLRERGDDFTARGIRQASEFE
ncbi:MAG: hypothetical protein O2992_14555 [Gemmatimonadetes bacterium]|nr:hypothetical protein [Gemmatimonadota bacterium]